MDEIRMPEEANHCPEIPPARWFRDIRKTALIAGSMSIISLPLPVWDSLRSTMVIGGEYVSWGMLAMFVMVAATLTIPLFYFCLYANRGGLTVSKRLRTLCAAGALALGAATMITLPALIQSFGADPGASVMSGEASLWTIGNLNHALSVFSDLACILPLLALAGAAPGPQRGISKPLRVVASIVAVAWGLFVTLLLLRLILTPLWYRDIRNVALQVGRTPPNPWKWVGESALILLQQFGFFVAPFVVWRSARETNEEAESPRPIV